MVGVVPQEGMGGEEEVEEEDVPVQASGSGEQQVSLLHITLPKNLSQNKTLTLLITN